MRDVVLRTLPRRPADHVAAVLVDEESLRREGPWPWSRSLLAALVDGVREAGGRGVVLDLLLPEARDGDEELVVALSRVPSVLAVGIDEKGLWLPPAASLRKAAPLAHVSFEADRDGVVRRFLATKQREERALPALAVAGVGVLFPERPMAVGAVVRPGFRAEDVPTASAAALLSKERQPMLRGRIVFVGASAAGIGDRVVSPVTRGGLPEPGVLVQAAACEALVQGDVLTPVPPLVAGLLAGLAALVAASLRGRLPALAAALLPVPLGVALLAFRSLELPLVTTAVGAVLVTATAELRAAARQRRENAAAARRVTELSTLLESLKEGRRDEAEARRIVAHELRTPLTSVRGLAQLLSDFDLSDDERKRVAGLVVTETSRLSGMVEALLDLERLKLRPFAEHARRIAFSTLVEQRLAVLGSGSARPVTVEVEPGIDVLGDPDILGRVLDNLVGNAFKHSPEETGIEVSLRVHARTRTARLEIADHGPGIAAEDRERIFGRFARTERSARTPGLGLGLALVAEAAAWHRGRVEVDAAPGGGSVFRFTLPLAAGGGRAA